MLLNSAVLTAALAILDVASASVIKRQVLKDKDIAGRIAGGAKIGDQCHPPGTYELGGEKVIPPCLAEQAIALKCEIITHLSSNSSEANRIAYHKCLVGHGSSYFLDIQGCLACKKTHGHLSKEQYDWYLQRWTAGYEAFEKDVVPKTNMWTYVEGAIGGTTCQNRNETLHGWKCWDQLPKGPGNTNKTVPVEEYYTNRPKTQNIGSFTLNGKKYPETTTMEVDLAQYTYEITGHLGYYSSAKLEDGTVTGPWVEYGVKVVTEYREIKSVCNFTTPDEFTIVSAISAPVPLKDSVATVPKKEASTLPTLDCDGTCIASALSIKELEVVVIQGSKKADPVVADAATPALTDLEEHKSLSPDSKISFLKRVEVLFANVKKYPTPSGGSPPSTDDDPCPSRRRR